jgi:very-short-patch-repair endonuclease
VVVEIDGGYHDNVVEKDLKRQRRLESMWWKVIRFNDKDVEVDVEAVARAIARVLNLVEGYRFVRAHAVLSLPRPSPGATTERRQ